MTQNITIKQARLKLGKKAENMSDEQVKQVLNFMYTLCERVVDTLEVRKEKCEA
jgi:hypothetical protein